MLEEDNNKKRYMSIHEIVKIIKEREEVVQKPGIFVLKRAIVWAVGFMFAGILVFAGANHLVEHAINSKAILWNFFNNSENGLKTMIVSAILGLGIGAMNTGGKIPTLKREYSEASRQLDLACEEVVSLKKLDSKKYDVRKTVLDLESKVFCVPNPDIKEELRTVQPDTIDTRIYAGLPNPPDFDSLDEHRKWVGDFTKEPFEDKVIIFKEDVSYIGRTPLYSISNLEKDQEQVIKENCDIGLETAIFLETSFPKSEEIPGMVKPKTRRKIRK